VYLLPITRQKRTLLIEQGGFMQSALINLNHPAHYFTFGPFSISIGNAVIIGVMIAIFAIALFLPFPHSKENR
jgi:hypothetical protein